MKHINFTCDLCDREIDHTSGTGLLRSFDKNTLSRAALDYGDSIKHLCNNCISEVVKLAAPKAELEQFTPRAEVLSDPPSSFRGT